MKVSDLLAGYTYELVLGDEEVVIDSISYHSNHILQDSLFVCVEGANHDGHDYIAQAVMKGCAAIIVQKKVALEFVPKHCTVIQVEDTRKLLPFIASQFYKNPSRDFRLVGVTGTNGKTSVTHLMSSILQYAERKVGSVGTLGTLLNQKEIPSHRSTPTTPEAIDLQQVFAHMRDRGVNDVIMEVSSMGLELHRVDGCDFTMAVFTNLSPEHLDDHVTFERYKQAKLRLFKMAPLAIINKDDEHANDFIQATKGTAKTYGIDSDDVELQATNIRSNGYGVRFTLLGEDLQEEVYVPIPGRFTVYNALAAISGCLALEVPLQTIIEALKTSTSPNGRLQTIYSPKGFTVMVDYAHTPDALENVLSNLKPYTSGNLITVFGCDGDRDKGKRVRMGEIASKWSDHIILTSDNPRTEEPKDIIKDIEHGIGPIREYDVFVDRKDAIHFALKYAEPNDTVLIAGKGNETYQIIGDEKLDFDDVEVVKKYILP